ncbi:glycoside hydrolase family 17 protein [Diaporthe amygdali]|uniref:glycoside hydrolase family 17 protein n=1 Tax=Phomopsis amygdali TaxID=1214568 RepID=UPI0022FDBEDD|nr:glycoside hydrolase family 17 protein [Diaporthe amygdali]KAJ0121560.1 glycoside hydrolase family 17 protein [Diaporthe amygdali]
MKSSSLVAAALLGGANAHAHRRAHDLFNKRSNDTEVCVPGCTTYYTTITGSDFIWQPTPNAPAKTTSSEVITPSAAVPVTTSAAPAASTPAVIPTPIAQTVPTPGTYTFPATTMTVTETTSTVVPSTVEVPPGTHTLGGVTTIVETATTVVCPYATVSTQSGGVVTSLIQTTTYVCPSAGTYTIAPTTVTVTAPTETVTVPVVTTFLPGTYTAPAVTTEVTTQTVIYCPFESAETPAATTSSAAAVIPPVSSIIPAVSSAVIPPVSSILSAVSSAVIPPVSSIIPVASSASSTSSSATASSTSTGSLGGGEGLWAMTYTPYDSDSGDCKTSDVIDTDVSSIAAAGFKTLRVYSTDCDTLPMVGSAVSKYGLKMITGIFISEYGCANGTPDVDTQISALKEWGQWDLVELMAVGNEALYNGYCTAQQLVDLINHVKSEIPDYTGPYTTTDIVGAWEQEDVQSLVCDAIDVVAANVHSYFNADVLPVDAGEFVKGQIEIVEKACGGKPGYVLECGYPTQGNTNGVNVPSVANQQIAIASIKETLGDKVVFFSMFDDNWKDDGACGCEKHWGVGTLFGALGLGDNE